MYNFFFFVVFLNENKFVYESRFVNMYILKIDGRFSICVYSLRLEDPFLPLWTMKSITVLNEQKFYFIYILLYNF